MEEIPNLPSSGAPPEEETKRHNTLRRDILTSLLEVDQSIKGLEHSLTHRIQEMEGSLRVGPAQTAHPASEPATRCEFNPAATTEWALRLLQEHLAPISSEMASLKEGLRVLRGERGKGEGLAQLASETGDLKETLRSLREEVARIQDGLAGLKDAVAPLREASPAILESASAHSQGLSVLRNDLEEIRATASGVREAVAALREETRGIQNSVLGLKDTLTPLKAEMRGFQDSLSALKETVAPLRDTSAETLEAVRAISQNLTALRDDTASLPGALRSLREQVETGLRQHAERQATLWEEMETRIRKPLVDLNTLLKEVGGKILEEMSLLSVEARRSAAAAPEAEARLTQHLESLGAGQEAVGQTLLRIRKSLEQSQGTVESLARVQRIVEKNDEALGQILESNQQVARSFETYHQAAREEESRIRQRSAQEQNNRGVLLYYRGSPEAAEHAFRKALESEPGNAEAWNNLGLALSRQAKEAEAVAAFEKAIELDPKMGEVYNNLGFLYHTTLKYDRALEMFNQAIQTSSDSAVAYTNLGNTYYKLSRHEQAVGAWKRALELDPLNENARRCLRMYQQENG